MLPKKSKKERAMISGSNVVRGSVMCYYVT